MPLIAFSLSLAGLVCLAPAGLAPSGELGPAMGIFAAQTKPPAKPDKAPAKPDKAPAKPDKAPAPPDKAPAPPEKAPAPPDKAPAKPDKAPAKPDKAPAKPDGGKQDGGAKDRSGTEKPPPEGSGEAAPKPPKAPAADEDGAAQEDKPRPKRRSAKRRKKKRGKRPAAPAPKGAGKPADRKQKPREEPAERDQKKPAKASITVKVGKPQFMNGQIRYIDRELAKTVDGVAQCVGDGGGLRRDRAKLAVQFLVRSRGRAEGVEVGESRDVSAAARRCVRRLLKNRWMGSPSDDPVGVSVTYQLQSRR